MLLRLCSGTRPAGLRHLLQARQHAADAGVQLRLVRGKLAEDPAGGRGRV